MMQQRPVALSLACAAAVLLVLATGAVWSQERADIVTFPDGSTVEGLLFEQAPGSYVMMRSSDGRLRYFTPDELAGVEHDAGQPLSGRYEDILLLQSGVILRGVIRSDVPGSHILVEVGGEDGARVTVRIDSGEIWKTMKRPVSQTEGPDSEQEVRREALVLELDITLGRRRAGPAASDDEDAVSSLAEDLARAEQARAREEADLCEDGPTREKGNGSQSDAGVDVAPRPVRTPPSDPTAFEEWRLADITDQLRADSESLADQAASPAGDPATRAALEDRMEARARLNGIMWPRVGTGWLQHYRIRQAAAELPVADREFLYRTNKRQDLLLGMGLNAVPALNLGSWAQGDRSGALANTLLMAGGGAILWASYHYAASLQAVEVPWTVVGIPYPATWFWTGTAVMGAAWVSSVVRPVIYQEQCNRLLADSLDVPRAPRSLR